jgi:hypothetical protein
MRNICHIIGIHLRKNQVVCLTILSIRGALFQYQEYNFRFPVQIFRQMGRVGIPGRRAPGGALKSEVWLHDRKTGKL